MKQNCSRGLPINMTHGKQGAHIARTHPYTNSRPAQVRIFQNRIIFNPLFTGDFVNHFLLLLFWEHITGGQNMFLGPRRDPAMVTQKLQLSCNNAPITLKPAGGGEGSARGRDLTFSQKMSVKFPA